MSDGFSVLSTGVFSRSGRSEIPERAFYGILSGSLLWGLGATAFVADQVIKANYHPGYLAIIFLGLVIPIIGVVISIKSDNAIISFLGYNMIVFPFGAIIGPEVNRYSPEIVRNVFGMTAAITIIMGSAGILFSHFFSKIGLVLFFSLFGLLIIRIAQIFIPGLDLSLFDYIGAGIFSLYIGYDMWRASEVPRTADNAIDISVNLYLDIINLFLNLLRIFGKK